MGALKCGHEGVALYEGRVILQVLGTTDEKPGIVYAELEYGEIERRRTNMPIMQQKRFDLYSLVDKTM